MIAMLARLPSAPHAAPRLRALAGAALWPLLAACAAQTYGRSQPEQPIRGAVEQSLRDLSLMRDAPPALLNQAAAAPYRLDPVTARAALVQEIADLDAVLGPDIDAPREADDERIDGSDILTGAIRGAFDLPYRSIVRRLTGADRRDRRLRAAILAGMARRAFLKGAARGMCDTAGTPTLD